MRHKIWYVVGLWLLLAVGYSLLSHPGHAAAACAPQDTSRGSVTSSFTVPSTGTYRVWSRILAPDTTNNSFILEIDGTTCGVVVGDGTAIPASTWTWVDYQNGSSSNLINIPLTAGSHSLTLIGREDNVEVDRVIFTTDTTAGSTCNPPTGTGDTCVSPPDTTPPTVSITAPTAGSTVNGTVNVQVTAADDPGGSGMSKVEYYVDGTLKATDTSSPYSYPFDTTSVVNGSHTIIAKAYDVVGNNASSTVAVNVKNAAVCTAGSSTLPTTPTGLSKTGSTYTSINFSWNASTPSPGCTISSYKIFRGGTQIGTSTTTSYADSTGLSAGTSYNYNVVAVDSGTNNSAQSALASFSTNPDDVAPTTPTNFKATAGTTASITLNWTASTDLPNPGGVGVRGYDIFRNGASITGTPTYTVTGGATTSYTDTSVSSSTTYSYVIVAVDNNGNPSGPSNSVSATTPAPTCSGKPTIPSGLLQSSQSNTTIGMSWSPSTAATGCILSGYHVFSGGVKIADVTSGSSYTDSGLLPNHGYTYTVQAYDTSGHSSNQSAALSASTSPDTTAPTDPGSVTELASLTTAQASVSWTASTDNVAVGSYNIYRATGTGSSVLLISVSAATLTYNDQSVACNTDYTYQVEAVDTSNNKSANRVTAAPSPVHTLACVDKTPPIQPTFPTTYVVATNSVQLSWTKSTDNVGVVGYHITINGVADTYDGDAAATAFPSFVAGCLAPNVQYTFTITAFDAAGNNSLPAAITTGMNIFQNPSNQNLEK